MTQSFVNATVKAPYSNVKHLQKPHISVNTLASSVRFAFQHTIIRHYYEYFFRDGTIVSDSHIIKATG